MKRYVYMQSGQKISEKKQINKKRCFYNPLENLEKVWYTKDGTRTLAYEYEYSKKWGIFVWLFI